MCLRTCVDRSDGTSGQAVPRDIDAAAFECRLAGGPEREKVRRRAAAGVHPGQVRGQSAGFRKPSQRDSLEQVEGTDCVPLRARHRRRQLCYGRGGGRACRNESGDPRCSHRQAVGDHPFGEFGQRCLEAGTVLGQRLVQHRLPVGTTPRRRGDVREPQPLRQGRQDDRSSVRKTINLGRVRLHAVSVPHPAAAYARVLEQLTTGSHGHGFPHALQSQDGRFGRYSIMSPASIARLGRGSSAARSRATASSPG